MLVIPIREYYCPAPSTKYDILTELDSIQELFGLKLLNMSQNCLLLAFFHFVPLMIYNSISLKKISCPTFGYGYLAT